MKKVFLYVLLTVPCFWCCKSVPTPSADYMILDEVRYINRFPQVFTLTNGEAVDLDIIGAFSISVQDSLLIVCTTNGEGMWSFFGLPDHKYLGKYLTRGNGPNELRSPPSLENQFFLKEQGELFAKIFLYSTGKLYRMNISETLQKNRLSMNEPDSISRGLYDLCFIDNSTFLRKESNSERTQLTRYIWRNGEKVSSKNVENLNKALIKQTGDLRKQIEDIAILSTYTKSSPDGNRIVEASPWLNVINLYSLDDSFGRTICVGKRIENISRVQQMERMDRRFTYMRVYVYPKFFGVLYNDTVNVKYGEEEVYNRSIRFFDWDGNPLSELKLEGNILDYAIDFIYGTLYTLNRDTEEILKYDIREILKKL